MWFTSIKIETETKRDDSVELSRFFVLGVFLLSFLNACGQTPEVLMVQGGKLGSCPSKTVKQMVDGFMGFPSWEGFVAEDGNNYVNVSGDITYAEKPVKALLQFKVNKDETFEYNALEYNGVVQNSLEAMGLLTTMCEEGTGSSSEESSSLEEPDSPSALGGDIVTKDEFQKIKTGMTYSEVVAIIGAEGEEVSSGGEGRFRTIIFMWQNPSGSNMNTMFQNDKLKNKAQFGLE